MMAGEQIAFTMGFTMASILDPSSGTSMPVTAQILNLLALMFFLAFDGHHLIAKIICNISPAIIPKITSLISCKTKKLSKCKDSNLAKGYKYIVKNKTIVLFTTIGMELCEKKGKKTIRPLILARSNIKVTTFLSPK